MNYQLKKGLFVFGVGFLIAWLLIPSDKTKAPKATENRAQQKLNALAALEVVRKAIVEDQISEAEFESLKADIFDEYALRIYYNAPDGRYYVADAEGTVLVRS